MNTETEQIIDKLADGGISALNVAEITALKESDIYLSVFEGQIDAVETQKLIRYAVLYGWPVDGRWNGTKIVRARDFLVKDDAPVRNPITGAPLAPGDKWLRAFQVNPESQLIVAHEFKLKDNLFQGMNEAQIVAQFLMPNNALVEFATDRLNEAKQEDSDSYRDAKKFLNGSTAKKKAVGDDEVSPVLKGSAVDKRVFRELLIEKFTIEEISALARDANDHDIEVSGGQTKGAVALNLIDYANRRCWLDKLLVAAIRRDGAFRAAIKPNNEYIVNTSGGALILA